MEDFVNIPFTADPTTLGDNAVEFLEGRWEDWEPNDADQEVILIEAIAPMAANATAVAANMPAAALRTIGTKLYEVAYASALSATTLVTLTTIDTAEEPRSIPAGSELQIDGQVFATVNDAVVPAEGTEVANVEVVAQEPGSEGEGLAGLVTAPISMPVWIATIVVESVTTGGVDAEEDGAYQNRLSRDLRLRAKTLVTATDYELEALDQDGVGRAHASVNKETKEMTITLTDLLGNATSTPLKEALLVEYEKLHQSSWVVLIADATYTTVGVTWEVVAYPGYDSTALLNRINARLDEVLSPLGYSLLESGEWWNEPTVYLDKLIAIIGNVPGVDRVSKLEINGEAKDLLMAGTVPLPRPGTMTGVVK